MTKCRSPRLRKKLRVGEFQEFGFGTQVQLKSELPDEAIGSFVDDFLAQAIEPRGLDFGGWADSGFVAKASRGSATEDDRAAVLAWLQQRPEVKSAKVSELVDAWNAHSYDNLF